MLLLGGASHSLKIERIIFLLASQGTSKTCNNSPTGWDKRTSLSLGTLLCSRLVWRKALWWKLHLTSQKSVYSLRTDRMFYRKEVHNYEYIIICVNQAPPSSKIKWKSPASVSWNLSVTLTWYFKWAFRIKLTRSHREKEVHVLLWDISVQGPEKHLLLLSQPPATMCHRKEKRYWVKKKMLKRTTLFQNPYGKTWAMITLGSESDVIWLFRSTC